MTHFKMANVHQIEHLWRQCAHTYNTHDRNVCSGNRICSKRPLLASQLLCGKSIRCRNDSFCRWISATRLHTNTKDTPKWSVEIVQVSHTHTHEISLQECERERREKSGAHRYDAILMDTKNQLHQHQRNNRPTILLLANHCSCASIFERLLLQIFFN